MILIEPDIHGRLFWKNSINEFADKVDKIIFLGDYLDSYPNEGITRKEAITNFEEIIEYKLNNMDKVILLFGNHDSHYYSRDFAKSSRYDSSNAWHIAEMFKKHRTLFKIAHEEIVNEKKYLFSHAGLMNSWVERNKDIIGEPTTSSLNNLLNIPQGARALSEVSSYRSWFGEPSGSIIWSDVREKIDDKSEMDNIIANEDSIVDGYDYQIFGHTQQIKDPIITDKWACLDCRQAFVLNDEGIIENEQPN